MRRAAEVALHSLFTLFLFCFSPLLERVRNAPLNGEFRCESSAVCAWNIETVTARKKKRKQKKSLQSRMKHTIVGTQKQPMRVTQSREDAGRTYAEHGKDGGAREGRARGREALRRDDFPFLGLQSLTGADRAIQKQAHAQHAAHVSR